jgi:hypothetical protein
MVWGIGPVFLLPTASEALLGSEKWGLGPTGVALVQKGPWTIGALTNHLWSVAGDNSRAKVNATLLQPFLSYITPAKTTYSINTESVYNWEENEWSVPINAGISQLFKVGNQPISLGANARYWVESPDSGPNGWGIRLTLTFLFPK